MYKYSPIKSILVKNFRNIGEVKLEFDESPIISLIGENESGKTSLVKAFGVCAMHCDPRAQKDYIRDGTQGFGVAIELEDGTQIVRIKQGTANRYTVVKGNGEVVWDATKLENDVPKAVQDVMGLIEEPETKELLHIRTYEDQLLFVVTPASTNYKVMYDALKISQITKAIKAGSVEANNLKHTISQTETSMLTLNQSLASVKTYDMEPLLNVKNKLIQERAILDKMDAIMAVIEEKESLLRQLGALRELEESGVSSIDIREATMWDAVDRVVNELNSLKSKQSAYLELSNAESVDVAGVNKLNEAVDRANSINEMTIRSKNFVDLANLDTISEVEVSNLLRAYDIESSIERAKEMISIYDTGEAQAIDLRELTSIDQMGRMIDGMARIEADKATIAQIDAYVEQMLAYMKWAGVTTTNCPKCGEDIVIDLEKIGG